eukprot:TRINITY_DN19257_c0_g1_i1.p1 TRINITY_DN19257_c0_g1~~TRINITY_DN19257_c0_g1_i1.p1  ORF type:complete len:120 (-),score=13.72 TRINITY_DN19257_c0_g1_i1:101-460(-)
MAKAKTCNFPLKKGWFKHLSTNQSIAKETRNATIVGDLAVVGVCVYALYRVYDQHISGVHQTRLRHLSGLPPAIVAHEFNFEDVSQNRKVDKSVLVNYRDEFAAQRTSGASVESFIFKY